MFNLDWLNGYEIVYASELNSEVFINEKGNCRFCKRNEPEVSFRKLAHVVPDFLGNKYLFSVDECDACNQKFGNTIETDLANFIGIHRTLTVIEGKKGVPKKHFQKERERVYLGKSNVLEFVSRESGSSISLDKENKTVTVRSKKEPYYPFGVFKALMKVALNIIPKEYLSEYSEALEWVQEAHSNPIFIHPDLIQGFYTFIPGFNPFPDINILIIKRLDFVHDMPYMIFRICFKNFIYQIPLWRGTKDIPLIGERHGKISMKLIPNYHDYCGRKQLFGSSRSKLIKLGGHEKIFSEEESFEFSFDEMQPVEINGMTINNKDEVEYGKISKINNKY
ncbi:HNH endonuclease [Pantoea sp. Mb-10]|uniref:HNH endonuclease n=1 Tax=unclassified Pantoea TaxID=2630326 RepID=UPI001E37C73C|nr:MULTISPECIES: HNH endonuclease [unclassified Pantoea]MCE0490313.1 HNH endonuclease [Pantoea sp. Mb-10]MCE0501444.1 HNH endonuclease [Pantoea sp. Pb-8]